MKFIVLAAFVCCSLAAVTQRPGLKTELEARAKALMTRVKDEIKKLTSEKREHLAGLLKEEEERITTLASELAKVDANDVVQTAILEERLITSEFRVAHEVDILVRERLNQELLVDNANILREWTTEEIKRLEATEGPEKSRAQEVARQLTRSEARLVEIAKELKETKSQIQIERLEVELRVIEARLYEALRALHFNPNSTGSPATGTTHSATKPGTGTTPEPVTTVGPITTKAPAHHTTKAAVGKKEKLIERAQELEAMADAEIKKLTAEGKTAEVAVLKIDEAAVKKLVTDLKAATAEADIQELEKELKAADAKLSAQIKKDEKKENHSTKVHKATTEAGATTEAA